MGSSRRRFLIAGSAAALSTSLALWYRASSKGTRSLRHRPTPGLVRDPKGILDLAPGFAYRVVERAGEAMSDGYRVPARPDAMGCFQLAGGHYALMRNHELDPSLFEFGPYNEGQSVPAQAYDPHSVGGVTRVVVNGEGKRISSNLVLVGTARNCAGGVSPWGWLSCEEYIEAGHGYVFLCAKDADGLRTAQRISAYGRFLHEAACVDEATHTAYLTEDRQDGCLYRFVPDRREDPHGKGRLQALAVTRGPAFELAKAVPPDTTFEVKWIDVPPEAGEKNDSLRHAAQQLGAAVVRRGEGICRVSDGLVFTSTEGGPQEIGQIFHLAYTNEGGTLRILAQADEHTALDMPDNITVSPFGDLLVCEDNHRNPHLRVVTRAGAVLPFARNAMSRSEFAGACFSPDGRLLFVNIQEDGLTLAIRGPFQTLSKQT